MFNVMKREYINRDGLISLLTEIGVVGLTADQSDTNKIVLSGATFCGLTFDIESMYAISSATIYTVVYNTKEGNEFIMISQFDGYLAQVTYSNNVGNHASSSCLFSFLAGRRGDRMHVMCAPQKANGYISVIYPFNFFEFKSQSTIPSQLFLTKLCGLYTQSSSDDHEEEYGARQNSWTDNIYVCQNGVNYAPKTKLSDNNGHEFCACGAFLYIPWDDEMI